MGAAAGTLAFAESAALEATAAKAAAAIAASVEGAMLASLGVLLVESIFVDMVAATASMVLCSVSAKVLERPLTGTRDKTLLSVA